MSESQEIMRVESLSKQYRLGLIGTGTLSHDVNRWWHRVRGLPDPYMKVGIENDRTTEGGEYVWALKDIDFSVNQGDVLGIIGNNGAGKSTLLKLLSGITGPTSGKIYYKGRIASLLEVGTGFHPELTGRENIYLNGAILGMSKQEIKGKLDEIVEFSGVTKYLDTPTKRYSSGMTVRLGFAVAAHLEPEILIVDEVLAVGDADFQQRCIAKMQDVSRDGRTVLFVSHNMASIRSLCNKGIVLKNGMVDYRSDNIEEVLEHYLKHHHLRDTQDVSDRTDRRGIGEVRLTGIRAAAGKVTDDLRDHSNLISSGMPMEVTLQITNHQKVDYPVDIRVAILNQHRVPLTIAHNLMSGRNHILKPGFNEITLTCDRLPLAKGVFIIDVGIRAYNVVQDNLEDATRIKVHDYDFFKNGYVSPSWFKALYTDWNWTD